MAKYICRVETRDTYILEVEADSEDEARAYAEEHFGEGEWKNGGVDTDIRQAG